MTLLLSGAKLSSSAGVTTAKTSFSISNPFTVSARLISVLQWEQNVFWLMRWLQAACSRLKLWVSPRAAAVILTGIETSPKEIVILLIVAAMVLVFISPSRFFHPATWDAGLVV